MDTLLGNLELLGLGLFVFSTGIGSLLKLGGELSFKQMHHAYIGAVLFTVGMLLGVLSTPVMILGVLVTLDDAEQHAVQLATGNNLYHSPLRKLYTNTIPTWSWVAWLNRWLDERLH